jgi:hypothetical protein
MDVRLTGRHKGLRESMEGTWPQYSVKEHLLVQNYLEGGGMLHI